MPSIEDILITFLGRDEVSPVAQAMASNTQSALSGLESNAISGANNIGQAYNSTFNEITQGLHSINSAMMGLSSVNRTVMGELGASKSAMEYVYGTTSAEDTNKVLVQGWGDAQTSWEDLYKTVDDVTDRSLTSMQDLIPAMNAFRASTNATGTELKDSVAENMAQFGAYVLALTGSEQLSKTAMTDLSKGLVGKGSFNAVDQYGVTKDSLMQHGWSGDNEDIDGYMKAVRSISGAVQDLMNTNEGLDAQLGKMWSRAGKRIGHDLMPGLKSLKVAFMELDEELDGNLSTSVLRVSLLIEEASRKAYVLNTLWDAFKNIREAVKMAGSVLGLFNTVQDANNLAQKENNKLLQESNLALMENNELRLANADAMASQTLISQGINYGGDMMPYGEEGMEYYTGMEGDSSWGEDVLANTAGGVLESKYQKMRGRESSNVGTSAKGLGKPSRIANDGAKVVGPVSGLGTAYYQELFKESSETAKIVPKTNAELKSMFASLEKAPRLSTNIDERLKQLKTVTDYALKENNEMQEFKKYLTKPSDLYTAHESIKTLNEQSENIRDELSSWQDTLSDWETIEEALENPTGDLNKKLKLNAKDWEGFDIQAEKDRAISKIDELKKASVDINKEKEILYDLAKNKSDDFPLADSIDAVIGQNFTKEVDPSELIKNESEAITLSQLIKNKFANIKTSLISAFDTIKGTPRAIYTKVTGTGKGIKNTITSAFKNFGKTTEEIASGESKGIIDRLDYALAKPFRKTPKVPVDKVDDVGDAVRDTVKGTEKVAKAGAEAGAVAPVMAEAETGLTFLGLSEMGLVGAFTTLIVPTLAIAGVIAVLIPIIAGLVIEALFFIGIVKDVFNSMNFSDVNLDGAIDGLSELAIGLGWLAVALGSLSVAGLMTAIATVLTGFGQVDIVIGQAVDMLKKTVTEINKFASGEQIKPGVAEQISEVGNAINSVSLALMSLVGTQVVSSIGFLATGFGYFGDLSQTFHNAKEDLQNAINEINSMNFTGIDENKVNQIKTVMEAIGSFADAFSGLSDIRNTTNIGDALNWLLNGGPFGDGGISIRQAVEGAETEIREAVNALNSYDSLPAINEGVGEKLKNIGTAISGFADAFTSLRKIRDDSNWDDMVGGIFNNGNDIQTVFAQAKTDIENVAKELADMDGKIADIPEGLSDKLNKVINTLDQVNNAINNLKAISDSSGKKGVDLTKAVETLKLAKTQLAQASTELKNLNEGGEGGDGALVTTDGLDTKLENMTNTLSKVLGAIQVLSDLNNATGGGANLSNIKTVIDNSAQAIRDSATALKGLTGEGGIGEVSDISGTINSIVNNLKALNTAVAVLMTFPPINPDLTATNISNAVSGVKKASESLAGLGDGDNVSPAVPTALNSINNALNNLKTVSTNLTTNFPVVFPDVVGMQVANAVSGVKKASEQLKNLNEGDKVNDIQGILNNINSAVTSLKQTIQNISFSGEGRHIAQSLTNGVSALNLQPIVHSRVASAVAGSGAWTQGKNMGTSLTNGFRTGLDLVNAINTEINNLIEAINNRMPDVQGAMSNLNQTATTGDSGNEGGARSMGEDSIARYSNMLRNNEIDTSRLHTMSTMGRSSSNVSSQNNPTHIIISEGAVQVDANNLTKKEARQVLINGLEGLSDIKSIQTN